MLLELQNKPCSRTAIFYVNEAQKIMIENTPKPHPKKIVSDKKSFDGDLVRRNQDSILANQDSHSHAENSLLDSKKRISKMLPIENLMEKRSKGS